ncbi:nicotinate-nucleotide-dimethylbenzimidazole phosphoribosyltransferase [Clostridium acidisoli DSM 12555]|uniref:Nicotinate-nucleotide--dimethylbenzimidazole phosphoribosyltransferase n=1 Tax=Clostridium acidisoli DSM 12555 TaxID=1121291 RepID=A0A1W1XL59_9CLOT|nr:nicotinate-nucleotide--dimethylbenzimidazole phosphoribosyltransferase [Clostridium acidisoli]SMC24686.1 nicotinate-nucleotide-dimethylbenzimidazole phosphoribosyltransferase [Clostridium acidisoli DSM 12555]
MKLLQETLRGIEPSNKLAIKNAMNVIDNLSKPIGSLGMLEEISAKMAGIKGELKYEKYKKNIIIMCGDNGVVEEGVSTCPQNITRIVMENFTKGTTGVCVLAKKEHAEITVIDVGVNADFNNKKIINKKIAYGTKNIAKGPAMSRSQAIRAIEIGIETVNELSKYGYDMFGTGEMGVGNTTTSAAILSVLLQIDLESAVGKGSGLTDKQLENKKSVVKKAIEVNLPQKSDVIDVISKVGGFDIAALCGCFLGAAEKKLPIVIDGLISSVAALCAYELNNNVKDYIFPSHISAEPGMAFVMKKMGIEPVLNLKMRLGEGSGCPIAFNLIETALYTINNMASFNEAGINKKFYIDIRKA